MTATDDCHLIRLHGPWQAAAGSEQTAEAKRTEVDSAEAGSVGHSIDASVYRFKVPGPLPKELSTVTTVVLSRKWNRPPSGLTERSKMFVIIDSVGEVLSASVNQVELLEVPHDEARTVCGTSPGTMFAIPGEAVDSFNELRIELDNRLQNSELRSVQLGITSSEEFRGS